MEKWRKGKKRNKRKGERIEERGVTEREWAYERRNEKHRK